MKSARVILFVAGFCILAGIARAQINETAPASDADRLMREGSRHLGDLMYSFDVEAITGDIRLLGVEFDD